MQLRLVTDAPQPTTAFDQFWAAYPRKVGKGHARPAFKRALRLTDMQTILAGIERYKAHKPARVDYCHPATWLNGERWDDEYEEAKDATAAALEDGLARWREQNGHG